MRVLVPFGTRPEVIKLSPVVSELRRRGHETLVVFTGQHHSPGMSSDIADELEFAIDLAYKLPGDADSRHGALYTNARLALREKRPDLVLVLGDTATVPAFAVAARSLHTPLAHIEAGLRSFNPKSTEELNRRMVATLANVHFAPSLLNANLLVREGVAPRSVFVTGNPGIDAVKALAIPRVSLSARHGIVFTVHRPTNVDDPDRLESIVHLVRQLADEWGRVLFPIHPRTHHRLAEHGMGKQLSKHEGVVLTAPLSYRNMLSEIARARAIVTDSGGLQEEANWFGIPTVVLRGSTPRWESVLAGVVRLVGVDVEKALLSVRAYCADDEQLRVSEVPPLYGDGQAARRIVDFLEHHSMAELFDLSEPDYTNSSVPGIVALCAGDWRHAHFPTVEEGLPEQ